MKNSVIILLFLTVFSHHLFADQIDKIAVLLQQGKANELVRQCAAKMELNILGEEKVVSATQAEAALNNFFSANKPVSVKIIHRMNTNPGFQLAVVTMRTNNGNFRISYSLKNSNGNQELTELRIESEKEL